MTEAAIRFQPEPVGAHKGAGLQWPGYGSHEPDRRASQSGCARRRGLKANPVHRLSRACRRSTILSVFLNIAINASIFLSTVSKPVMTIPFSSRVSCRLDIGESQFPMFPHRQRYRLNLFLHSVSTISRSDKPMPAIQLRNRIECHTNRVREQVQTSDLPSTKEGLHLGPHLLNGFRSGL